MRRRGLPSPRLLSVVGCALLHAGLAHAQIASSLNRSAQGATQQVTAAAPASRITQPVDDAARVTLRGNTHPLAQAQFDRGVAPADLPMNRMLLVLKRSDAQEAALEKLLDDQQDQNSPSYHQWLTPDQFGQQFGPSDQDVQTIAAWLRSHGFQIGSIGRGRTVVEFSGTASQVQQAFRTEIHKFTVNGEDHWANASDPQIPAALAPVVEGVASLHNFRYRPMYHVMTSGTKPAMPAGAHAGGTEYTTQDSNLCPGSGNCYFVGPYDFATIYNILPLWNGSPAIDGTGQSIAVAEVSNINVQDVRDFRNLFGLPANDPQVLLNGPDPGLVSGAETEALLDVEWAGAVAKGATIKMVVSQPTNSTQGADLAALYAIENNLAPVLSESFGNCELFLGTAGNSFENAIRQQAAAEGITFITAAGDSGSAGCDGYNGTTPAPATYGLAVSGLASSPYGVAVGGTDFINFGSSFNVNSPSPYWNTNNSSQNQSSAITYVPESTWNDSCTNGILVLLQWGSTPEAACNNSQLPAGAVVPVGGSGGKSNCTSSDGANVSSCRGGYAKPTWQAAPGVPADGARYIPDVSLFAGDGLMASAYIVCEADAPSPHGTCSLNSPNYSFLPVGGTSASAQVFAGILALVNQYTEASGQGNANYVLYKLASSSAQTAQSCNASVTPASGCIFNDVTSGTIAEPCAKSSPNCNFSNPSDTYGILTGYSAGSGYDLATGLGSVNAYNLAHKWLQPTASSTTRLTLNGGANVSIKHGQSVSYSIDVTPSAATGQVTLVGTPTSSGSVSMASFPLVGGAASGTTTALGGGTSYQVHAHYAGDGVYGPSDSSPVTVTVAPENSKTLITIPVFNAQTAAETGNMPASLGYGTPYIEHVDVGNAQATAKFPPQIVCVLLTCPTGSVTLSDTVGGATTQLGTFALNDAGYVEDYSVQFSGGMHTLSASYSGDNSYDGSAGTYALTVTPAATKILSSNPSLPPTVATPFGLGVILTMNVFGAMPACNFTFYDGASALQGTPSCTWQANGPFLYANIPAVQATAGTHTYSAKFNGDSNYAPSTSAAMTTQVYYGTTLNLSVDNSTVQYGSTVTLNATLDSTVQQGPAISNTVAFFSGANAVSGNVSYTPIKDSSGNIALQAVVMFTPQSTGWYYAYFKGDSNYYQSNSNSVFVMVNIPDFSVGTKQNGALPIVAGQSATTTITVTPATNATSPVTLACNTGAVPGSTCNFAPSIVTLSNSSASNAMLTVSILPPSASNTTALVLPIPHYLPSSQGRPMSLACLLLASLLLLTIAHRLCSYRIAWAFGLACLLAGLGISCGTGGGGTGGGPGGGGGQVPTTISLTTSAVKAPATAPPTIQAKVTSTRSLTGYVYFYDGGNQVGTANVLADGTAPFVPFFTLAPGTHVLTASYVGDASNMASKTANALNQVITGTSFLSITGTTGTLTQSTQLSVEIQ